MKKVPAMAKAQKMKGPESTQDTRVEYDKKKGIKMDPKLETATHRHKKGK